MDVQEPHRTCCDIFDRNNDDFGVEISAAFLFGMMAFLAAGTDALFDALTSVGVLAGLRISKRPPDRGHLYGHRQAETLVSVLLAGALVFASLRITLLSLGKIY